MAFDFPVFLDLTGASVLVVGAGPVGLRKAAGAVAAGAAVTVVAPEFVAGFDELTVERLQRRFEPTDLDARQLVFVASGDPAVNAGVAAAAKAAGVWVNAADDPENCSFILPAVGRQGRLSVAVSTGGGSPALAQRLRDQIVHGVLTERVVHAADVLATERDAIHGEGRSTEGLDWATRLNQLLDPDD